MNSEGLVSAAFQSELKFKESERIALFLECPIDDAFPTPTNDDDDDDDVVYHEIIAQPQFIHSLG